MDAPPAVRFPGAVEPRVWPIYDDVCAAAAGSDGCARNVGESAGDLANHQERTRDDADRRAANAGCAARCARTGDRVTRLAKMVCSGEQSDRRAAVFETRLAIPAN